MPEQGLNRATVAESSVKAALQPRLKKALQVVQDPEMFWEGYGEKQPRVNPHHFYTTQPSACAGQPLVHQSRNAMDVDEDEPQERHQNPQSQLFCKVQGKTHVSEKPSRN